MKLTETQLTCSPAQSWPRDLLSRFEARAAIVQHAYVAALGEISTKWTWKIWVVAWDERPAREPALVLPDGPGIGVDQANLQTSLHEYLAVEGDEVAARRWIVRHIAAGAAMVVAERGWNGEPFEEARRIVFRDPRHVLVGAWRRHRDGVRSVRLVFEEVVEGVAAYAEVKLRDDAPPIRLNFEDGLLPVERLKDAPAQLRSPRWTSASLMIERRDGLILWEGTPIQP